MQKTNHMLIDFADALQVSTLEAMQGVER
jgi:hypothetical protein